MYYIYLVKSTISQVNVKFQQNSIIISAAFRHFASRDKKKFTALKGNLHFFYNL